MSSTEIRARTVTTADANIIEWQQRTRLRNPLGEKVRRYTDGNATYSVFQDYHGVLFPNGPDGSAQDISRLEVTKRSANDHVDYKLMEMDVIIDPSGTLLGLKNDRFRVWDRDDDGNIFMYTYKAIPGMSFESQLESINRYRPSERHSTSAQIYHDGKFLENVPHKDRILDAVPLFADWQLTYGKYTLGKNPDTPALSGLKGKDITANLLVPSETELLKYLNELRPLINIDCGTENKAGVDRVGIIIEKRCRSMGFDVRRIKREKYGDIRIISMKGKGKGKVMLMGHLDTIFQNGTVESRPMTIDREGKLRGPGTSDMKAGVQNAIWAMKELKDGGFDDFEEIHLVLNGDEEVGSPESREVYLPFAREMDAVLVLEEARKDGEIVSARKGVGQWNFQINSSHSDANPISEMARKITQMYKLNYYVRDPLSIAEATVNTGVIIGQFASKIPGEKIGTWKVEFKGRESHAGMQPEDGINAIAEAANLINRINDRDTNTGLKIYPRFIRGGKKFNQIPGYCEVIIDVYSSDGQTGTDTSEEVEDLLRKHNESRITKSTYTFSKLGNTDYIAYDSITGNYTRVSCDLRAKDISGMDTVISNLKSISEDSASQDFKTVLGESNGFSHPPMIKTPAVTYLADLAREAGQEAGIPDLRDVYTGGGSDANPIAYLGIPTLDGLGPIGWEDHSEREWVSIDSILPRKNMLANLIRKIIQNRDSLAKKRGI